MPVRKKQKRERVHEDALSSSDEESAPRIMVNLVDETGKCTGGQLLLPVTASQKELDIVLTSLLEDEDKKTIPYAFFIEGEQVTESVKDLLFKKQKSLFLKKMLEEGRRVRSQDLEKLEFQSPEETAVEVVYKPQAVFRIRPLTRCAGALDGHSEAVLICLFSPDSEVLATGGGDKEIRIWDVNTLTPSAELKAHHSWVQTLSWSPDSRCLVSGSKDGVIAVWTHSEYTNFKSKTYKAHNNYVSHACWEPLHANLDCCRFVTASRDTSLKVWNVKTGLLFTLSGHSSGVTCVKWGGNGFIFSSSQDRTILVWNDKDGAPKHVLRGHGHWVNFLALSTDLVLRTGAFDHKEKAFSDRLELQNYAKERYMEVVSRFNGSERLVSCSDDNTLFLWDPQATKPLTRLTGHQGIVFQIQFSPDGTLIASCSADNSVKLWNAADGKFITTFRGHVAAVYHISWSLDSRLLVSASKDTTLKLWSIAKRELIEDLSGHSDEVYTSDWSPDGQKMASGSKDKKVRIWVH